MATVQEAADREKRSIDQEEMSEISNASATLWNMSIIAANDMLVRGTYITDHIVDNKRAAEGAICGGLQACAVGSLWLGGEVPMVITLVDDEEYKHLSDAEVRALVDQERFDDLKFMLPNTDTSQRLDLFHERPYMGLAYHALNNAALRFLARKDPEKLAYWLKNLTVPTGGPYDGWAEQLFESDVISVSDLSQTMVDIIEDARYLVDRQTSELIASAPR